MKNYFLRNLTGWSCWSLMLGLSASCAPEQEPHDVQAALIQGAEGAVASEQAAAMLSPIRLSSDGTRFAQTTSGANFVPVGFNYTNPVGGLIEDFWYSDWERVVEDFGEMRALGANVVRVHLQVAKFMTGPSSMNEAAMERLARLLTLAESLGLYLDITGLSAYRAADDPAWYLALSEPQRWDAQAHFWRAIARAVRDSNAVFCLDLMNEPVVTNGADWTPGEYGGYSFVQRIVQDLGDRSAVTVARAWIGKLRNAIRAEGNTQLITVGLIPFLGGAFAPAGVADLLDFQSIHVYPSAGAVPDALAEIAFYDTGKPIVIEETAGTDQEFEWFLRAAKGRAEGFIGHYFGRTPTEPVEDIVQAVQRASIVLLQQTSARLQADAQRLAMHEYWNGSTRDHFFTTARNDALLRALGYSYGTTQGRLFWSDPGGGTPLCSYVDFNTGHHFLRAGCNVVTDAASGRRLDSVLGFVVNSDPSTTPLHRYRSSASGDFYYAAQRNDGGFAAYGYAYDGTEGRVYP
jgi:hypothetical protein